MKRREALKALVAIPLLGPAILDHLASIPVPQTGPQTFWVVMDGHGTVTAQDTPAGPEKLCVGYVEVTDDTCQLDGPWNAWGRDVHAMVDGKPVVKSTRTTP